MGPTKGCPLVVAGKYHQRLSGLLKKRKSNSVLLISPCHSIHTFGMKEPIDVAFFDSAGLVLKVASVPPGKVVKCRGAEGVLERFVPSDGRARHWFEVGDELKLAL